MPLQSPQNLLMLNARPNGLTRIIQEGNGFTAATTVTIDDQNAVANDRYTFAVNVVFLSARRLQIEVVCTPPVSGRRFARGIIVLTTAGPGADNSGPVPVVFLTRKQPVIDHSKFTKQKLRLNTALRSVVFVPITGLGDVIAGTASADKGTWTVRKATQMRGKLKLTLDCTNAMIPMVLGPLTSLLSITLTLEDETILEVPPVEVEYVNDPEEDPDP